MKSTNNLSLFYKLYSRMAKVAPVKWYARRNVYIVKFEK